MNARRKTRVICGMIFAIILVTALFINNKLFDGKLTCTGIITDHIDDWEYDSDCFIVEESKTGELRNNRKPVFKTDNISKIWFKFGPWEEIEVPGEDIEEITDWLETFKIGDKVKRRETQPAGTNSVSVKIEYSDGTIVENELSTMKIDKKEYHLIYEKAPACYMKIRNFCWN